MMGFSDSVMISQPLEVGTTIHIHDEDGIICCLEPLVYRTIAFHSYVWIQPDWEFVVTGVSTDKTPLPQKVRNTIVSYIEKTQTDVVTGE